MNEMDLQSADAEGGLERAKGGSKEIAGGEGTTRDCASFPAFRLHFAAGTARRRSPASRPLCGVAHEARGVEPVDAVERPEMTRQRAQIALRRQQLGKTADFRGADRLASERRAAFQEAGDLPRTLLDLERTGAIDQHALRLEHLTGAGDKALLSHGEPPEVLRAFQMWHVWMAAEGASRRARPDEQATVAL